MSDAPDVELLTPQGAELLQATRDLLEDYALHLTALGGHPELDGYQDRLLTLPGDYAEEAGGALLLALVDGEPAGCCALRRADDVPDCPNAAEMKRLFVRPVFRGFGLGRQLAAAALEAAMRLGYTAVLLDTLDTMQPARTLYSSLGFEPTEPFRHDAPAGTQFLRADLEHLPA
ncbi:MAG: GNAT family N-acetyltransferase [Rhodocyclaceae bacterium]|nr:GNAT family N-acetyltransferase [Rhodocyclaceae bacterium]